MTETEFVRAPIVLDAPRMQTQARTVLRLPVLVGRWVVVLAASVAWIVVVPLVETVLARWRGKPE